MAPNIRSHMRAIYGRAGMGTAATFTPNGGSPVPVRVLNVTKGADPSKPGDLYTVLPAARLRLTELAAAGVDQSELYGGTLVLSDGTTWTVKNHRIRPAPTGEAEGEAELILRAPA